MSLQEGTFRVSRIRVRRGGRKRVRFGAPDGTVTGSAGLVAVSELADRLGLVATLDRRIGPIKQRARGLSGGELLVGLATAQLLGEDAWVGLDRCRADRAGAALAPVPWAPSRTAATLAGRFGPAQLAGIEAAVGELTARWLRLLPAQRRADLVLSPPVIDMDSTDVEVYGRQKEGVAYNYQGQRCGRPHLASWAQAGITLAADLLSGNDDARPRSADLLRRALAGLPAQVTGRPRVRADAGYFDGGLARAAVDADADFAIAAKRNPAMWRAYHGIPAAAWRPARDMHNTEVAASDYAPAGWPPGSYTIVRRVRIPAEEVSADVRSRRRRTIPQEQLALALDGRLDMVDAVSFIVTNLPADDDGDLTAIEAWFRRRVDIEERIREAKLGAALRRLPSADVGLNTVWMWAALLAGLISVTLQSLARLDTATGRARAARLRFQLLRVPGRVIRHARGLTLRLPPGRQLLADVIPRLRALPLPA